VRGCKREIALPRGSKGSNVGEPGCRGWDGTVGVRRRSIEAAGRSTRGDGPLLRMVVEAR